MCKKELPDPGGARAVYELLVVRREGDDVSSRRLLGRATSALEAIKKAESLIDAHESVQSAKVKYQLDF